MELTRDERLRSEFSTWIGGVLAQGFDYYVAFARRCFNLAELTNRQVVVRSDNALLSRVDEIAEAYKTEKTFPSICVIDDIMVYGRNLQGFLDKYRKAIFCCLQEKGVLEEESRESVNRKLLSSIAIRVFIANESYNFLRSSYSWVLRSRTSLPMEKWRVDSKRFADWLWRCDVANTSHVLSYRVFSGVPEPFHFEEGSWERANGIRLSNERTHDFYTMTALARFGVFPTVRTRIIEENGGGYFLTPYCFFRDALNQATVDGMLHRVLQACAKGDSLPKLFAESKVCEPLYSVYAQLFNLVLSVITLSIFLRESSSADLPRDLHDEDLEKGTDISKILRNFSLEESDDASSELKSFVGKIWRHKWTESDLLDIVADGFKAGGLASSYEVSLDAPDSGDLSASEIVSAVEDAIYQQAIGSERKASGLYSRKGFQSSDEAYKGQVGVRGLPVNDFMRLTLSEKGFCSSRTGQVANFLSCLTLLMDSGEVSLRARYRNPDEGGYCSLDGEDDACLSSGYVSEVRTTEMTLSILPCRLGDRYREFCQLADVLWVSDGFPEYALRALCGAERDSVLNDGNSEEKEYARNVDLFAKAIIDNRDINHALLEWRNVFPEK